MERKTKTSSSSDLPPDFRFHPTDEELIMFYLKNQAKSKPCPVSIIPEVDIYKFDPWQLPDKAEFGENEWYFFTPRDRKYPNGVRSNRATVFGYWKATGTDKAIYSDSKYVGVKKALVFYNGRPPKGVKTNWIMHEYRLNESRKQTREKNGSMRLDDWVLCRIYKKKSSAAKVLDQKVEESKAEIESIDDGGGQELLKFPRTCSLSQLLEMDYMGPISHFLTENTCSLGFDFTNSVVNSGIGDVDKLPVGEIPYNYYATDSGKFQFH
ncbi:NAC-LIKE, ACTIVATED BY AP3/PI, Arabidopsis NAC domain containing protein 29, NAC-like [Hibiscus trionum]|uniref:NAC-LIKE, ACTIVATED BY AP3/PI, Arabidopsis NAC domain containing protein 29, NAC-like n=1 Tax=Hibiscus trionum TaxID=183268 RepID=A0A9W7JBR7_HIBTR|nr:NAC-LIKE, ACTIVATED BY AP3/PI, Arabidopsis NAC domain containing protein 29, NAC-like [Hibiscus trionum]